MKKKLDELQELALPLRKYLEKNYDSHCAVIVAYDEIKIIRDEIYLPTATVKQPSEEFVPEDSHGKCLKSESIRCPN